MRVFFIVSVLIFLYATQLEARGIGQGIDVRLKTPSCGVLARTTSAGIVKTLSTAQVTPPP